MLDIIQTVKQKINNLQTLIKHMASDGDTITYSYTGSKQTEDISYIQEITIDGMNGTGGGHNDSSTQTSGGRLSNYVFDVSAYDTLEIWVGRRGRVDDATGGFGRSNGGDGYESSNNAGGGGGSTELWVDSNSTFIAAVDGGGGDIGINAQTGEEFGGGGGARGGVGGSGSDDGEDVTPQGGGSAGGDGATAGESGSAENGGQSVNGNLVTSSGTASKGGGNTGDGDITVSFTSTSLPITIGNEPVLEVTIDGTQVTSTTIGGSNVF